MRYAKQLILFLLQMATWSAIFLLILYAGSLLFATLSLYALGVHTDAHWRELMREEIFYQVNRNIIFLVAPFVPIAALLECRRIVLEGVQERLDNLESWIHPVTVFTTGITSFPFIGVRILVLLSAMSFSVAYEAKTRPSFEILNIVSLLSIPSFPIATLLCSRLSSIAIILAREIFGLESDPVQLHGDKTSSSAYRKQS